MKKERIKDLLLTALHYAMEWEEGRLDANVALGDRAQEREMKNNIRAFDKLRDAIDKNRPMTMREYLNSLPKEAFVSVHELMSTKIEDGGSK